MNLPLRLRLTLWYFAVLAASFVAFGAAADFAMRHSIAVTVDDALRKDVAGIRGVIIAELQEGGGALNDELDELNATQASGLILDVAAADGSYHYVGRVAGEIKVTSANPAGGRDADGREFFTVHVNGRQFRGERERVEAAGRTFTIEVATPTEAFDQALDRFRWILLLASPALLILASLGGYWMSRRALRPVDEIIGTARSIGAENLSRRLGVPAAHDELRRLTETLNEMLARIEAAFQKIRQFTADASHELRTPVALMRTSAELALRKPRSEAEYREALTQILEATERTSDLIDGLLTLARADAAASGLAAGVLDLARTDLADCIRKVSRQAETLAAPNSIQVAAHVPPEPVWVRADARVLERLLLILLDNAVKYTPREGKIEVALTASNGTAQIAVRDTGPGIAAADLPHIFDRFYRADKARSSETGGAGLGLSIGRWIAESHGGSLTAESGASGGATFTIRLPIEAAPKS
jgi:heavy metal sensor kinase